MLDSKPKYSLDRKVYPNDETVAKAMLLDRYTVKEWEQGGMLFRIDAITPKKIGATVRNYELFENDTPAAGGRWHATLNDAEERAEFVAAGHMAAQIRTLEHHIRDYRWNMRNKDAALEAAMEALESYPDGNRETIEMIKCALNDESVDIPFVGRTPWK